MSKIFWEFKVLADKKGELYLYGEISDTTWFGDEVTPSSFAKDMADLGEIENMDIFLNSPGGDVFAGITIYNMLKRHTANKTVHVDGIAASAASIVAMAGDKIVMPKAATIMIHNAWGVSVGNKTDMRKLADELERIDGQLADIYSDRTGNKTDIVAGWMDEEKWMSGAEAFDLGFADEIESNKKIAACADVDKFFALYQHPPKIEAPDIQKTIQENDGVPFEPINGEDIPQPVLDITEPEAQAQPDVLKEQRETNDRIKRKLLEV